MQLLFFKQGLGAHPWAAGSDALERISGSGKQRFVCPDFMRREEHGAVLRWALVKTGPGGKDAKDQSAPLALAVRRGRPPACFCLLFARAKRRSPSGETWPFLLALSKEMGSENSPSRTQSLPLIRPACAGRLPPMGEGFGRKAKPAGSWRAPVLYLLVHLPVAPQGRARPLSVTGRPSSSDTVCPPNLPPMTDCKM